MGSHKTDHCENYVKVLIVTFIFRVANLDLREELMF